MIFTKRVIPVLALTLRLLMPAEDVCSQTDPMEMVLVPAGEFSMGDTFAEGYDDELPVHDVYLDAYFFGKYEVTNAQFIQFLTDGLARDEIHLTEDVVTLKDGNICYQLDQYHPNSLNSRICFDDGQFIIDELYENHPVCFVTWQGAVAFCNWLSMTEGLDSCYNAKYEVNFSRNGYRLPTEAEWEKAAKGVVSPNRYPWGGDIDGSYANYPGSGDPFEESGGIPTTPVGYYNGSSHGGFWTRDNASIYQAYDMAGNVMEWCNDWFGELYYQYCVIRNVTANPPGPLYGEQRIIRGGGCYNARYELHLRCANRSQESPQPAVSMKITGFRCAQSCRVSSVDSEPGIPEEIVLHQNFPNPFNTETWITFHVTRRMVLTVDVYSIQGRLTRRLYRGPMGQGGISLKWDGMDRQERPCPSGVYLLYIHSAHFTAAQRLLLIR